MPAPRLDILAFGAHPDDVELSCGGLLLNMVERGHRVGVVDLSGGERGTQGTAEIRRREAASAAKVLGLAGRDNLGLPDTEIRDEPAARRLVAARIRSYRPRVILAPWEGDEHPDHAAAARLIVRASFLAGLRRYGPAGRVYRPRTILHYMGRCPMPVSVVVDISPVFRRKIKAIKCYQSQLLPRRGVRTELSRPGFLEDLEVRHRYYGLLIGCRYGEPYLARGPVPLEDPLAAWR